MICKKLYYHIYICTKYDHFLAMLYIKIGFNGDVFFPCCKTLQKPHKNAIKLYEFYFTNVLHLFFCNMFVLSAYFHCK